MGGCPKVGSGIVEFEATSVPSNPSPFGVFDSGISAAELLKPKFEANPLQILTGSHPVDELRLSPVSINAQPSLRSPRSRVPA